MTPRARRHETTSDHVALWQAAGAVAHTGVAHPWVPRGYYQRAGTGPSPFKGADVEHGGA